MSECGVCLGGDFGDGEPYEFSEMRWPKARKEHKCGECGRTIQSGEKYQSFRGKCDGDFYHEITCHQCAEIREVFSCEAWPMWGELWNDAREVLFPVLTTACFAKLRTPEAREFLRAKWIEWKFAKRPRN
jgi:hypothetical protein